jgi:hypothetical protein
VAQEDSVANLSITNVVVRRSSQEGRDRFTASARIANSGSTARRAVPVSLAINGRVVETRTVEVPPKNVVNATFASVAVPEGTTRATVSLPDTALAKDNDFHFVVAADQTVGVLVIEDESPLPNQSFFVKSALDIGETPKFRVDVRAASRTGFGDLDRRAIVILNDAPFPGGDLGRRIKEFVSDGGGLFVIVGDQSNASGWTGDAAALMPGRVGNVIQRPPGNGAALATIDRDHPIFEVFNAPRSGDFSGSRFFSYRPLQPADSARELAHFDDGSVAMMEGTYGKGRVVVFGAALDGADLHTDLPRHVVFLPYMHQVVKHVASFSDARPWFNVGEVVDVLQQAQPSGAASPSRSAGEAAISLMDLALITPSGDPVVSDTAAKPGFAELDEKGFYELRRGGDRTSTTPLAVNVDLAEADLSRFDPVDLVTSVQHRVSDGSGGAYGRNLTAEQKERRQNLWWYLLFLALLLLVGETMLGNRLSPALRGRTS